MVREKEFAHLQGTMGRLYAAASGEPEGVALAVEEHYRPGAADDPLPTTLPGRVLALADRADTLVTLFAAGHRPTGAKDPFALRRAAIGLCRILLEDDDRAFAALTLEAVVDLAAKVAAVPEDAAAGVLSFVEGRLRQNFLDRGYRDDMVEAVLAGEGRRPADRAARLDALASFYGNRDEYLPLAIAFKRPINILRQGRERELAWGNFDEGLIGQEEERALLGEFRAVEPDVEAAISGGDYGRALELLAKMRPTVDKYFDEVMVMCEDEKLRANRLAMMQLLADLFLSFADFTRLRGEEDYE
jgi:glycyl-tRNA synthetase beta chain